MKFDNEVEDSLKGLKDFQKATVEYAFSRFQQGQKRFLIADEVGLGKTIVARGIIAKLYQQHYKKNKEFVVVYICSNRALAKQNINKLSFLPNQNNVIEFEDENDRLSDLAYENKNALSNPYNFKIKAFTPATSFDNRTSAGKQKERLLLYRLLKKEFSASRVSLMWMLKGGNRISNPSWIKKVEETEIAEKKEKNPIKADLEAKFLKRIKKPLDKNSKLYAQLQKGEKSLRDILKRVLIPRKRNSSFTNESYVYNSQNYRIIAELRYQLNEVCADYLKADLFVLDEFQRFSNLIHAKEADDENAEDPGSEIARKIFLKKNSKILLLSATPFKAYTNYANEIEGENHYTEFRKVLRFLLQNEDEDFWKSLDENNHSFFKALQGLHQSENDINISEYKRKIETIYRNCISRTERTLVEENKFEEKSVTNTLNVNKEDIVDFLVFDSVIKEVNEHSLNKRSLPVPIEYVKSSPFPLSFLQDYEHLKVIEEEVLNNQSLKKFIKSAKRAFVPSDRIENFKPLLTESAKSETPNPKLRLLYDETVRNGGWKLLWVPPSVSYYIPGKSSAFHLHKDFSKTLIFSAWKMVPRMVSALVSYEAERYSVGKFLQNSDSKEMKYFSKKRLPLPRLVFRKGLKNMNNFLLAYPSVFLAELYNPRQNLIEKRGLSSIRANIKKQIKNRLSELGVGIGSSLGVSDGDWQKWNWFALFLLDRHTQNPALEAWTKMSFQDNSFVESDEEKKSNQKGGKKEHFDEMRRCLSDKNYMPHLGKLSKENFENLLNHLTDLTIGSPAVCSLRALNQLYDAQKAEHIQCAYNVGMAFVSLFNKPESIAIIDNKFDDNENYYSNVVHYCVEGNIQSMLDEYIYQLKDSSGLKTATESAQLICDILTVNASNQEIKTQRSLIESKENLKIRTHYAVPFGLGNSADLKNGKRQIKVREAFNSPFRPFVLTSTSIGQEGLDFHYYCNKIIHWNLPPNPIDLEQREGRIKRYKSLAIRKSIASQFVEKIAEDSSTWEELYKIAMENKTEEVCDLVPFWYMGQESEIKSIIPIYPFSKDNNKIEYIKKVLANYRLTFGQPRQEELVIALGKLTEDQRQKNELDNLLINLTPIKFL